MMYTTLLESEPCPVWSGHYNDVYHTIGKLESEPCPVWSGHYNDVYHTIRK